MPTDVKLKDPKQFKIIGRPVKRLDTPEKVTAEAIFGIDVKLPGMLTGVVVRSPAFGAQVASMNAEKAKAAPGVKAVVPISTGIVVVADTYWNARKAAELLEVQWGEGTLVGRSSSDLWATLEEAAKLDGIVARKEGDVGSARPVKTVTAKYHLPYLAHAAMEPMTCTASVKPEGVEVWVGTQAQTAVQQNAAAITGLKPEQVKVHTTFLGGGFGRRAAQDFVNAAVEASKAVGAPVKVIYSREDDTRGAYYRPISYTEVTGGLDEKGEAVMINAKLVVPSLAEATGFRRLIREDGIDRVAVEGLADMPYHIPELRVNWVNHDFGIPIWFWRSVGATHNTYVTETFIDEMAHAAGADPYQFRRKLLSKHPRHLGVLDLAARRRVGASRCPRAWGAGSRWWNASADGPRRWPRSRSRTAGRGSIAWSVPSTAARWSIRSRSRRRCKAGSSTRCRPRSMARSRSRTAGSSRATSTIIRCCAWPSRRRSRSTSCRAGRNRAGSASRVRPRRPRQWRTRSSR